jgi:hypothetical protein
MSWKRKHLELRNFVPNHFAEDKNARNLAKEKPLQIRSEPFKNKEKNKRLSFNKKTFFRTIPFCFVPNLGMGYSETQGIPRKEHFFSTE